METCKYLTADFWASSHVEVMGKESRYFPASILKALPSGAVLFKTSGSSGKEKWVVHTRETLQASAQAVNTYFSVTSTDIFGLLLPEVHVGGFGILARAYVGGAQCVTYTEKWNPLRAVDFLATHCVSITSMVPTQIYDLVKTELRAPLTLQVIIVGGGALERDLGRQARDLGWNVLQSYGMTEAASQVATGKRCSLTEPFHRDNLSILPCWTVCIDVSGVLYLKGDALCKGLLVKEGGSWDFTSIEGEWMTQDRVELRNGTLTFLGRRDRLIKVKGELVDLDALEQALMQRFKSECVLLPVKDERDGAKLACFTTLELDFKVLSNALPRFVDISECKTVKALPRSVLGKVDRRSLRALL